MHGDETIIVTPEVGRDEWGDPMPSGPQRRIDGCAVIPRRVNTPERGVVLIDGFEVFAPPVPAALAITSRDTIKVRGDDYQVDGEPGQYFKRGAFRAVQVFVKRVST